MKVDFSLLVKGRALGSAMGATPRRVTGAVVAFFFSPDPQRRVVNKNQERSMFYVALQSKRNEGV
jgi:hypothetical protein